MKRWISWGDIEDAYFKSRQRGFGFILSKLNWKALSRTKSAFSASAFQSANWWIIPAVKARWNDKISGNQSINYRGYLAENILAHRRHLRLLSLGSGSSTHEIELAKYSVFDEITCVDLVQNQLDIAKESARSQGLENINFQCGDIRRMDFSSSPYDVVLFNSSLHHFENIAGLIDELVLPALKDEGYLVINEYVGPSRLQFPKDQVSAINQALQIVPSEYRKRYRSKARKNRFYPSGILRMILADPSEAIDSASILTAIHERMDVLQEKPYGGNILMNVLKDIAHHFVELDSKQKTVLEQLFRFEDEYLSDHQSDFVFGVYQKRAVKQ